MYSIQCENTVRLRFHSNLNAKRFRRENDRLLYFVGRAFGGSFPLITKSLPGWEVCTQPFSVLVDILLPGKHVGHSREQSKADGQTREPEIRVEWPNHIWGRKIRRTVMSHTSVPGDEGWSFSENPACWYSVEDRRPVVKSSKMPLCWPRGSCLFFWYEASTGLVVSF